MSNIKELILEGLDCPNCANQIENKVRNINGINQVSVDFVSNKILLDIDDKNDVDKITKEVINTINNLEPDVRVIEKKDNLEKENINNGNQKKIQLILGTIIFVIAVIFKFSNFIEYMLYITSYILVGSGILLKAIKNIFKGNLFDENFLMSIATLGAFAIGELPEGVAVMLFYQIGEIFQDLAVNKSRKSISELMNIRPDYANLKINDDIKKVSPEEVKIGDIIIVKPGEKIPLDGKIIDGKSMVDTSALTGESVPREAKIGNEVLSGFINKNGVLIVEVVKEFGQSTVSKILDLVQNASNKKAPTQNFITKFAKYYTPIVVIISIIIAIIPPFLLHDNTFSEWIYRALVFLVISCPCALVVSIPLGFFGGIGGASRIGVLIKGSNYLEALNNVKIVVFDKTGTLTKGVFKVTDIVSKSSFSKNELLEFAAYGESFSNHPIALSILNAYEKDVNKNLIENYEEISGHGVKAKINKKETLIGNSKLMDKENIKIDLISSIGTVVHIAVDKEYAGYIIISDEIKEDSEKVLKSLKKIGINKNIMLTGDVKSVAEAISKEIGLDEVYSELLPDQKVERFEIISNSNLEKGKTVFVGDGINDAPVLARADIGISMGGLGSDAAIEAADIVIMDDKLSKIYDAIKISRRTKNIVWQNIIFALGIKIVFLSLGACGIATMWEAVFADVGVTIISVINSMRALKVNKL